MLSPEKRRETVDSVVAMVVEKGRLVAAEGPFRTYELGLSLCTFKVVTGDDIKSVVEIAENFGGPNSQPRDWQDETFNGIRTLYRGGSDGLHEVALQGINIPYHGIALPPAESIRRSRELTDGRELTEGDIVRFDAFLQYAQQELNPKKNN